MLTNNRILHLSLNKKAFEVMITGEKKEEFRKNSDWIRSRLFDKDGNEKQYDYIKFTNGYGVDRPCFICQYIDFVECYMDVAERKYSNGLSITGIGKGDFIIFFGEIEYKQDKSIKKVVKSESCVGCNNIPNCRNKWWDNKGCNEKC